MNSGQTCIAPDYVLIHSSKEQEFLRLASLSIEKLFYKNNVLDKSSYGKIISASHYQRLKTLRDKAIEDGAMIIKGGADSDEDQTIEPVLLSKVSASSAIMQVRNYSDLCFLL